MVDVEAAWGPNTTPNFTDSATLPTQALDPHAKPRLRRDPVAEEWTSAECEPAGSLPYSSGVSPAWDPSPTQVQQASRSKTTTMTKKKKKRTNKKTRTNTHTKKRRPTHRDSHRSKVTRSTSTLRLHKTSPGTDNTTAPARRKQEGQRSKSLSVQLQKRYQRGRPLVGSQLGLFFFSFSFFKLSFISNVS